MHVVGGWAWSEIEKQADHDKCVSWKAFEESNTIPAETYLIWFVILEILHMIKFE